MQKNLSIGEEGPMNNFYLVGLETLRRMFNKFRKKWLAARLAFPLSHDI